MTTALSLHEEVASALRDGHPVVALESTILSHGLPPGRNLDVARRLEGVVRDGGAVPATIAVLDGRVVVGLSPAELERVCAPDAGLDKLSLRDLGPAVGLGRSGATTVASTSALAAAAGIGMFATGGLGGVHVGAAQSWDVSADLGVLAKVPTVVVCSGVKSVLDIPATLEVLETNSVPVLGYRTDDFPAFYLRSSGHPVGWRVDDPKRAAAVIDAHRAYAKSGVLLANPIPEASEMDKELHDRLLAEGLALVEERDVHGADVTPVLLEHFHTASGGVSIDANEALVLNNAKLAAEVAVALV
ncbi:indigoidine synthase A family protein [Amycolatopsis mediterranei S699]|uniref:Pseudouridine-5'-phosphate glycosidase n=2 Tax=Amycolatopsis mediterranei TaxID=33910 RepID=A0A0H3D0E5_AMYMU|nr:pseudouridine-5'-phosphate glycosidase [Amycolatopsis mediterranei]ADJ44369.1 indigoidine synthase A family protein [Amycolatopsis mediterranei U32]AEK41106.1 indigoidine synthase A family protein [Amycolatopsis mediterranei S699]AFO76082.1 indigoidine synthase A family protein [Amycolatopsis mediterranei S699]AGT83211.1 indigoidine synthase A family protein [Amycolatopsis mediterranei RB]KDO06714.1 pseudouridine-5'-phosphate glycosidase [Amycolatopsis mediterranei]